MEGRLSLYYTCILFLHQPKVPFEGVGGCSSLSLTNQLIL
ncbi:AgrD family cyclic lactone autoinducer peptide [Pontibacter liquoris]